MTYPLKLLKLHMRCLTAHVHAYQTSTLVSRRNCTCIHCLSQSKDITLQLYNSNTNMPLTVLSDHDVSRILHSLNKQDIEELQENLADALHWYSTSSDANDCCSDYQPERTHLKRKDGSTTLFMPASGITGQGVKVSLQSHSPSNLILTTDDSFRLSTLCLLIQLDFLQSLIARVSVLVILVAPSVHSLDKIPFPLSTQRDRARPPPLLLHQ